jgi:hypothetical protein
MRVSPFILLLSQAESVIPIITRADALVVYLGFGRDLRESAGEMAVGCPGPRAKFGYDEAFPFLQNGTISVASRSGTLGSFTGYGPSQR